MTLPKALSTVNRRFISRVLGGIGLLLLASTALTLVLGHRHYGWVKAGLGAVFLIASLALSDAGSLGRFRTGRAARFALSTGLLAAAVIGLVVAASVAASHHPTTWDFTKNHIFTLSDESLKTLRELDRDITVLCFYRRLDPQRAQLEALLKRYADETPHFHYQLIDPLKSPELVRQHAISEHAARIVLTGGTVEVRVREPNEQGLTNGLIKATRGGRRTVYYTQGHGEPDVSRDDNAGYAEAARALRLEGLELAPLSLLEMPGVPPDASSVQIVSPTRAFAASEVDALKRYLDEGGRLAVFLEPGVDAGLDGLLAEWGTEVGNDLVMDAAAGRLPGGTPTTAIVQVLAGPETIRGVQAAALPAARSLAIRSGAARQPTPLLLTGEASWSETTVGEGEAANARFDRGEKKGPLLAALAVTEPLADAAGKRSREARLVVFGDGQFFDDQHLHLLQNRELYVNVTDWQASLLDPVTIRQRSRDAGNLFISQKKLARIRFLTIDVLPVGLTAIGLAIWLVRRSR